MPLCLIRPHAPYRTPVLVPHRPKASGRPMATPEGARCPWQSPNTTCWVRTLTGPAHTPRHNSHSCGRLPPAVCTHAPEVHPWNGAVRRIMTAHGKEPSMSVDSIMHTEFPKGYTVLFGADEKVIMTPQSEEHSSTIRSMQIDSLA